MDNKSLENLIIAVEQKVTNSINEAKATIDFRIKTQVHKIYADQLELQRKETAEALKRLSKEGEILTKEAMQSIIAELHGHINEMHVNSGNYQLYQMMHDIQSEISDLKIMFQPEVDKIDYDITSKELKQLYKLSELSPSYCAEKLNISESWFYSVLNGKKRNAVIDNNRIKKFLLIEIKKQGGI